MVARRGERAGGLRRSGAASLSALLERAGVAHGERGTETVEVATRALYVVIEKYLEGKAGLRLRLFFLAS